jgi:hypothetical protein
LVPATKAGQFTTRTLIDIFSADRMMLAGHIDLMTRMSEDLLKEKTRPFELAMSNFAADALRSRYEEVFNL